MKLVIDTDKYGITDDCTILLLKQGDLGSVVFRNVSPSELDKLTPEYMMENFCDENCAVCKMVHDESKELQTTMHEESVRTGEANTWNVVLKVLRMSDNDEIAECFGRKTADEVFLTMRLSTIRSCIESYEKKKMSKVKAGDEFIYNGNTYIAYAIDSHVNGFNPTTGNSCSAFIENVTKTGRSFPEFAKFAQAYIEDFKDE